MKIEGTIPNAQSRDYFRNKILLPLLKSGRLKMTIPEKPKSTKQKYVKP